MNRLSAIVFFAVLLIQYGCSTYSIDRPGNRPSPKLDRTGSAYVCLCEDGKFRSKVYQGSGIVTAQIIKGNLSKYLSKVTIGENTETCDEALRGALYKGDKYLFCPSLVQWEDHKTEQTGIQDTITIEIIVFDTLSRIQLDAATIVGKGSAVSQRRNKPQDLLATPIRIYIDSLFQ